MCRFKKKEMLKINLDNKYAIFFDHFALINAAYSKNLIASCEKYEISAQLFNFHAKKTETTLPTLPEAFNETTNKKRRQRKRKINSENESTTTKDVEALRIKDYLMLLHQQHDFSRKNQSRMDTQQLARYWEMPYTLPKLNGANVSGSVQQFRYSETTPTYLIPNECHFFNCNVIEELPSNLTQYDLIVIDPPWRNKYIRRLKRAKHELGYAMLDNAQLSLLPIEKFLKHQTLVAIWCTNSPQHKRALMDELLPKWNLRLLHKLRWYKLNTNGELISAAAAEEDTRKQPYEMLYLACHIDAAPDYALGVKKLELLMSVPSIIHSHKPPLLDWLRNELIAAGVSEQQPTALEFFARYLQPGCTSIGLEVLKLMDSRLYEVKSS